MTEKMTIQEMQEIRTVMEARLQAVAAEIVDEFQRRTGLTIASVSIGLSTSYRVGEKHGINVVSDARLDVRL